VARYFPSEQARVDELAAAAEEASRAVEEYIEEHSGEDGPLSEAMDGDKISRTLATDRLKKARYEGTDPEEVGALQHLLKLYEAEAGARRAVKEAQAELDLDTLKQYGKLTEDDVKTLVLDDKWQATLVARISSEVEALSFGLVARVEELGDRYAATLDALDSELKTLEAKAFAHLVKMGIK
jgi:type I restriction enzyme M protein